MLLARRGADLRIANEQVRQGSIGARRCALARPQYQRIALSVGTVKQDLWASFFAPQFWRPLNLYCGSSLDGRSTIDSEIVQSLCFISEQNCPGLNWTYCPRSTYDETGLLLPGSQATSDAQRTLCPTECGQPESSPATVVGGSAVVRSACSASVVMPCALYHVTSCA